MSVGVLTAFTTANNPSDHAYTLNDTPAETYKLADRETEVIVKIGEITHGENR